MKPNENQSEKDKALGMLRVSSVKQGLNNDSTEDQERKIQKFADKLNLIVVNCFEFWQSASDEEIQPSFEIFKYLDEHPGEIKYLIVSYLDRFTRAGVYVYDTLQRRLAKYGVTLLDTQGIIGGKTVNTLEDLGLEYKWSVYNPTRKAEIDEIERAKSEVRISLTRMIGAEVRYVRDGYRVRPAPPGYMNTKVDTEDGARVVLAPHPNESDWFYRMFELSAQGNLSEDEVVEQVNALGYRSRIRKKRDKANKNKIIGTIGCNKLTIKALRRILVNPIYAGVNDEKWLDGKPIKGKFPGIVSIEMWNKANKGKHTIVEEKTPEGEEIVRIYKGIPPQWQLKKNRDNPAFPYKKQVLCPTCRKPLLGSNSTGRDGTKHGGYHCSRKGHYFRIPLKEFNQTIERFINNLHFSDYFRQRIQ